MMLTISEKVEIKNYFSIFNHFWLKKAPILPISEGVCYSWEAETAPRKGVRKVISTIIVALISLVGTLAGSLGGIMVSSKLTNYRIEQLEKKVDKHNNFAEKIPLINERMDEITRRLEVVERDRENY